MPQSLSSGRASFDRTNAIIAGLIFLTAFIVYALTVQRSFSFWDCGEFIACAYTLGIPHPPGTPLFVLLGRVFSFLPIGDDISFRINYLSVVSSAFTALFCYLITVRLVGYFFGDERNEAHNRWIAYVGGMVGSLFAAFGQTNWANSVESEVYGPSLALMTLMFWLALQYFEERGTPRGDRIMVLVFYIAIAGVAIHLTPFLMFPILAIFFVLKREATPRDWALVSGFIILELLYIILFADGRGGVNMFYLASGATVLVVLGMLYKKINWGIAIAVGSLASLMLSFSDFIIVAPAGAVLLVVLGAMSKKMGWGLKWKTALLIMIVGFIGFSAHLYIPIRSAHNPNIDENNPDRGITGWNFFKWDISTFENYLDRKQYGQESMTERMFHRRGLWENQLGRHANMGYWSYFEEQYSNGGVTFLPFLLLGLIGMAVAIKKRLELGMPFFALFLVCSLGLVLYMNFADGTHYTPANNAYLEVRNRDYFFTPAFVFFGIAMGMGVAGLVQMAAERLGGKNAGTKRTIAYASTLAVLLPGISLAHNYHINDRSNNYIPYNYAANMLDTCEKDAILFTSGDNDTFPLWCIQEVYNYRKDVRVVNLSLLNTDWYVWQRKEQFGVPISLKKDQVLWYPVEGQREGLSQPRERFRDRPRGRMAYLQAAPFGGRVVRVQDMMVDEIVLENKWQYPIYFSSQPYAESPLKLRERATAAGLLYRLDREPPTDLIDVETGLHLYENVYRYDGFQDSKVARDNNATGVFLSVGLNAVRLFDAISRKGDPEMAEEFLKKFITEYPEYWQGTYVLAERYDSRGDTAEALQAYQSLHDTLGAFHASNPENEFYTMDYGMVKVRLGKRIGDDTMIADGLDLMWKGYEMNANSGYGFQKLVTTLAEQNRFTEMRKAALMFAEYKMNRSNPLLQRIMNATSAPSPQALPAPTPTPTPSLPQTP